MLVTFTNHDTKTKRAFSEAMEGFLAYIRHVRGLSPHTTFHYGHDLTLFLRFVAHEMDVHQDKVMLDEIKGDHIKAFLQFLTFERGNSPRSNKRRLASLRAFFAYACDQGGICEQVCEELPVANNPALEVPIPSLQEKPPQTLGTGQVIELLRAARAHAPFPKRDYAILLLFLNCGARLSEAVNLEINDINLVAGSLRLGTGGSRERLTPLQGETRHALKAYLDSRPKVAEPRVFLNRHGHPITKGAVYHLLGRCLSSAGLAKSGVNIHTLRHTCFAHLAKEGFSSDKIQTLAGLRRPHTPRAYVKLSKTLED